MYPHERSLVKKLADKPFVLLGINSDPDREALKKVVEKEQLTWRSWWDAKDDGPIATAYNVSAWPTLHLIDHKGVIRYFNLGSTKIDEAIDKLLAELEMENKGAGK
jgi:Thioredoxin-like